jgi:hypothetical protein
MEQHPGGAPPSQRQPPYYSTANDFDAILNPDGSPQNQLQQQQLQQLSTSSNVHVHQVSPAAGVQQQQLPQLTITCQYDNSAALMEAASYQNQRHQPISVCLILYTTGHNFLYFHLVFASISIYNLYCSSWFIEAALVVGGSMLRLLLRIPSTPAQYRRRLEQQCHWSTPPVSRRRRSGTTNNKIKALYSTTTTMAWYCLFSLYLPLNSLNMR